MGKMLHADSRNFHGWGYRAFVIEALEELAGDGDEKSMAQTEIDYTTKMIGANLSNFSAWHYRTKLIQKHLNEKGATDQERRQVLEQGNYQLQPKKDAAVADFSSFLQNWNWLTKLSLTRTTSRSGFTIKT